MGQKQKTIQGNLVQLTPFNRISMLMLFFTQIILFVYFNLLMVHYVIFPMPSIFSADSLVSSSNKDTHYLYNGMLYSLFFVQHVGMALIAFKLKLKQTWAKYPLYERYFYNIASAISKPVSNAPVFTTPQYINLLLTIIASIFLALSVIKLGGTIFSPFPITKILTEKQIQVQNYQLSNDTNLVSTGLYGYCRHPMQASVVVLLLSASHLYTIDRIVFIAVHLIGIFVGVSFEEKRLKKRFIGYEEYMKKVPYKFIPYVV